MVSSLQDIYLLTECVTEHKFKGDQIQQWELETTGVICGRPGYRMPTKYARHHSLTDMLQKEFQQIQHQFVLEYEHFSSFFLLLSKDGESVHHLFNHSRCILAPPSLLFFILPVYGMPACHLLSRKNFYSYPRFLEANECILLTAASPT